MTGSAPPKLHPAAGGATHSPPMLSQALLIARLDLHRRLRDRSILLQVFLAPILLAVIVGGAFSGGGGNLDATIVIADADRTAVSGAVGSALTQTNTTDGESGGVTFETVPVANPVEASALVDSGAADAVIYIPAGYTAAVTEGEPATLTVVGKATSPIVTGVARSVADGINTRLRAQYIGTETAVRVSEQTGLPLDPAQLTEALNAEDVVVVADSRLTNTFNIMSFFAPGMAMIFLFFVMGTTARSVLTEQRDGTLGRVLAGPTPATAVVLGKAVAVYVLGLASMLMVYLVTTFAFGVDWGDPLGVVLVILAVVAAITGLSLIVTGLARNEEQAQSMTIIGTLLLAVLGGTFVYSASGPLSQARAFTPNGQALMAFIDLSAGQANWQDILPRVGIILAIGVVSGAIGLISIRRGLQP
ncbi:MAG: ABC transporter permease [Actinobacteria bacterium]|nr:ABC transporter permease [Actinomycetota bacterium]